MSTSVTRSIPTPGDLARTHPRPAATSQTSRPAAEQPRPQSAADLIKPGRLAPDERLLTTLHHGIRISGLAPYARLVALTMLGSTRADGSVRPYVTPAHLAASTGLDEAQVLVQLEVLVQRGWASRRTVTSGPHEGSRAFRLYVPEGVLQRIRVSKAARRRD